jgi:hypothetical protein
MGLETIVVETDAHINLSDLYRVKEAVEDVFDWYLGNDITKKLDKFIALRTKASKLTKQEILDALKTKHGEDSPTYAMFNSIPDRDVEDYLKMLNDAIGEFREDNSHLFFEWEKLPEKELATTCSYNLHELLFECAWRVYKNDVSELGYDKLKGLYERLNAKSFKFKLTKWIGYFFPSVADRMVQDMCHELGIDVDCWIDVNDLIYYRDELKGIVDNADTDKRLWLVSSY